MVRSLLIVATGLGVGSLLGCAVVALGGEPPPVETTRFVYEPALHPLVVAAGQVLATLAAFVAFERR